MKTANSQEFTDAPSQAIHFSEFSKESENPQESEKPPKNVQMHLWNRYLERGTTRGTGDDNKSSDE